MFRLLRPSLPPLRLSYPCLRRPYTDYTSATQLSKERDILHTRCTVVKMDEPTSEMRMVNVEKLSKTRLCRDNGIQPRDLRVLDTDIRDQPASILARTGSILFCLPSIRAIIKHDRVLLLEALTSEETPPAGPRPATIGEGHKTHTAQGGSEPPPSEVVQGIAGDIRRLRLRERATAHMFAVRKEEGEEEPEPEPEAPFEFLALESLLSHALSTLSQTSAQVTDRVSTLLQGMSTSEVISTDQLQELVEVKDAAEVFLRQAKELKLALDDILSDPADMRMLYLRDVQDGKTREVGDDDEVELLLEAYVKHASSLASTAQQNISRLQAASSHINLLLSSTRNRLLHLEIRVAITTLSFSAGGIIASIFGMNLLNGLETHPAAFYLVVPAIALVSATYWRIGRRALSYARRLKLSQAGMLGGAMREARMHQAAVMRAQHREMREHMRESAVGRQ